MKEKKERSISDLSSKQRFTMDFSLYLKKKNLREIDKYIYETKIRKK